MKRPVLALLCILALLQPTPPLRLEASTSRSEFIAGDRFTVVAILFNRGDTPALASLAIQAPAGFELIGQTPVYTQTPTIAAGRAIVVSWSYRVLPSAPHDLTRFLVVAYDDAGLPITGIPVVIRVGPIESRPPPMGWRVRLAVVRR